MKRAGAGDRMRQPLPPMFKTDSRVSRGLRMFAMRYAESRGIGTLCRQAGSRIDTVCQRRSTLATYLGIEIWPVV